jgi:hypothetical protein
VRLPDEIDVDGLVDGKGVRYIGKAARQPNGMYHALADVDGALCRVECRIIPKEEELKDYWEDLGHANPPEPPTKTDVVYLKLYADDALLLQGHLRHEQTRFKDAGNEVMVSVLLRVEAALEKARKRT